MTNDKVHSHVTRIIAVIKFPFRRFVENPQRKVCNAFYSLQRVQAVAVVTLSMALLYSN